jgi:hypothetical protein
MAVWLGVLPGFRLQREALSLASFFELSASHHSQFGSDREGAAAARRQTAAFMVI